MTKLLEKAIEAMRSLSSEEQDAVAREILSRIEDDARWDALLSSEASQSWLEGAARDAIQRQARGETRPVDPSDKPD